MKLVVAVDGSDVGEILVEGSGDLVNFTLNGVERTASAIEMEPGVYSVLIDGRSFAARVNGSEVEISGRKLSIEVSDPRRAVRKSRSGFGAGRQNISALMPGKLIRLLVSPGEAVEAGQGLVVVEAMKMQNEMKAPKAGTIVEVRVREGATVAAGEVLVVMD